MIDEVTLLGKRFLLLLGFLTTLPVPRRLWPKEPLSLPDALPLAPLVGALTASLSGAAYVLARPFVGGLPAAWIALACYVLSGWSLHLDGFSDLADGLGSHREGEAMRAVMKDSRLGGFGALALIVALGLWTSLVGSLGAKEGFKALLLAAVLGRLGICLAAWRGSYPWEAGLGREIVVRGTDLNRRLKVSSQDIALLCEEAQLAIAPGMALLEAALAAMGKVARDQEDELV